jgi:hypothetical protein
MRYLVCSLAHPFRHALRAVLLHIERVRTHAPLMPPRSGPRTIWFEAKFKLWIAFLCYSPFDIVVLMAIGLSFGSFSLDAGGIVGSCPWGRRLGAR